VNRAHEDQDFDATGHGDENGPLDDYVRGLGDETFAQAYEEDLFSRALAGTAPHLTFRAGLGATLRQMASRGTLDVWLTTAQVEQLQAAGQVRAVIFNFDPEHPVEPDIPPGTELLITRIPLDVKGARLLEADVFSSDGRLLKHMPDINFNPEDGAVYACCEAELARLAGTQPTLVRVWVTDDAGRRVVAELGGF